MGLFSKKNKIVVVDTEKKEEEEKEVKKDYWSCQKCGTNNPLQSRYCKDCGYYKSPSIADPINSKDT